MVGLRGRELKSSYPCDASGRADGHSVDNGQASPKSTTFKVIVLVAAFCQLGCITVLWINVRLACPVVSTAQLYYNVQLAMIIRNVTTQIIFLADPDGTRRANRATDLLI